MLFFPKTLQNLNNNAYICSLNHPMSFHTKEYDNEDF